MLTLSSPITTIPLIGPKYTKLLENLKIHTVENILHHYPTRYEDRRKAKEIVHLAMGERAVISGQVLEIAGTRTKGRKQLTKAVVADETGQIQVVWFGQTFLLNTFKKGSSITLFGNLSWFDRKPTLMNPKYFAGSDIATNPHMGRIVPIYPETRGVSSKWLRSRITAVLRTELELPDHLPEEIRLQQNLIKLDQAVRQIHFPETMEMQKAARNRLAFDEVFLLQLKSLLSKKNQLQGKRAICFSQAYLPARQASEAKLIQNLPFELTKAQQKCVEEILQDLEKDIPMNRLLEGDVGSGKTIVAVIVALRVLLHKSNVLYMAPTTVLAGQQYENIKRYLEPYNIKVRLLTGSTPKSGLGDMTPTNPVLTIGTHALLFNKEKHTNVGLVIVDEQHRFGVRQRQELIQLQENNQYPHTLTMTATPIPRSLALTIYSNLDLSTIDELPKGRQQIKTWVVPNQKREPAYKWISNQIVQHQTQAFIVCPFIEKSAHTDFAGVKAATEEFEHLQTVFPNLQLALLHGKTKPKQKEEILTKFRDKEFDILVATPVVEVGIDIPNATIMLVEGAERFGLASLHQLRGRVGRETKQSYCLLFTESKSAQALKRLKAMETHHNGLKLAEIDLEIRGPGELYGTSQHGYLALKLASLTDTELTSRTRKAAEKVAKEIEKYPELHRKIGTQQN